MNSRLKNAEQIKNLEETIMKITQSEQKKEKLKKSCIRVLWDNIKHANLHIIEVPEKNREEIKNVLAEKCIKPKETKHSYPVSGSTGGPK